MSIRSIKRVAKAKATMEGAGVHLSRAFGFGDPKELDPFLLFDDFRNDEPKHYRKGFPFHPHRGIETITYVLRGSVEHQDSLGNEGVLEAGDVQWMTSGRGIIHQEMPTGDENGHMYGFQLWANLPAKHKLTKPRYQEYKAEQIPTLDEQGASVRVISGSYMGTTGPVKGIAANPTYLDITLPAKAGKSIRVDRKAHAFAYVFEGSGQFGEAAHAEEAADRTLVVFGDGDEVVVHAGPEGIRFLLVSGEPLREPVAWRGPIVMNTDEELAQAFRELQEGTFLEGGD